MAFDDAVIFSAELPIRVATCIMGTERGGMLPGVTRQHRILILLRAIPTIKLSSILICCSVCGSRLLTQGGVLAAAASNIYTWLP